MKSIASLGSAWATERFPNSLHLIPIFFLFRRFDNLNARIILAMQDGICKLEEDLNAIDDLCSWTSGIDINNGSFRQETQENKEQIIWKIHQKLKDCSMAFKF